MYLPYPTLPYPTLPCTLPYPIVPYPTLPYSAIPYHTLPYPLPYRTLSLPPTLPHTLPYPTLNRPVNLPSMYFRYVRYSLMSVSVFSCVIIGLFWSVSLRSRLFWSVSVNLDTALTWTRGWVLVKLLSLYRLEPSYNNNITTGIRSRLLFLSPQNQSDRLIVYFRFDFRVSDTKISEEYIESFIDKSLIEFDLTYSLP